MSAPKTTRYQTLSEFLERTETALTNAQLPDIAPLLAYRGIDPMMVQMRLQEAAHLRTLDAVQKKEAGDQLQATRNYEAALEAVHQDYVDDLRLARIAFKNDPSAQKALELNGTRKQSKGGYAGQGWAFYDNALRDPGYQALLAQKGIKMPDLQLRQQAFENLKELSAVQQQETGESQMATAARDAAYDALADWMSDFYEIAKVALRRTPQLMEKLGILER
ncbi:MAG: hypothetical protein EOP52_03840 [Sphingobacteriales bacterium]|nr:MAG: hypothetical protein EOP52_03840 [Sphingobacteriales bacterium]